MAQVIQRHVAQPIHFGPNDKTLFGWYHPPAAGGQRACGVVLCNPVGDDYIRAHRPLRHLAERLARAGFAVLRFDFHGTGDSSGEERDPERVKTWLGDVTAAMHELRRRSGAAQIAVCGLRLGATLALAAAAAYPGGVASAVLWSPYLTGKAFVSETTKQHKLQRMIEPQSFAAGPKDHPEGQEALGFLLTHAAMAELAGLDLLALPARPAQHVLVLCAGKAPGEGQADGMAPLRAHLQGLGTDVSTRYLDGGKFLTMPPHRAALPSEELDAIVSWLSQRHPVVATDAAPVALPADPPAGALRLEEPRLFGKKNPLFGILVRPPPQVARADRPAIIMLNAGTVHRMGPHRYYVRMARRWAQLGFPVLRLDLSGIGDSPVPEGCEENLCYPRDAVSDIQEAMELLSAETGASGFVLMGLCSGGDNAFKMGLSDPRVLSAIMMNPRTFFVNDLKLVSSYHYARYYRMSLFNKRSWLRLLSGETNLLRVAARLLPKVKDQAVATLASLRSRLRREPPAAPDPQAPAQADIPACLRLMAERGVDAFLLVTAHDPGVEYVDAHFGKDMQALAGVRGFRREDIQGTDHTFTSLWAQEHVCGMLTEHLQRRYLSIMPPVRASGR